MKTRKIYKTKCENCLFTCKRLIDKEQAKELIEQCNKEGVVFECHTASEQNKRICCKSFYDAFKNSNLTLILGEKLGRLEFVDRER